MSVGSGKRPAICDSCFDIEDVSRDAAHRISDTAPPLPCLPFVEETTWNRASIAMDADTGQSSKQAGRELLESIFRDGTPATSANAAHLASTHFGRIEGKRLQLGNVDRARPVPGLKTRAHHQIQRRDQRLIKKKRRHQTTSSSLIEGKGKEREQEQKPFSRRERQRLGLEKIDENLSYEMMAPIRHLWLDYIHRLVGLVDENGAVQCNQFRRSKVAGKDGPVEVTLNANNVAAFQTSLVKADFCGAPMRGQWWRHLPARFPLLMFSP